MKPFGRNERFGVMVKYTMTRQHRFFYSEKLNIACIQETNVPFQSDLLCRAF